MMLGGGILFDPHAWQRRLPPKIPQPESHPCDCVIVPPFIFLYSESDLKCGKFNSQGLMRRCRCPVDGQHWWPSCTIHCISVLIQCICSVSALTPDTLRYNTYCIHCIWSRYSGYRLYQPLVQIRWIRIVQLGPR